MTQKKVSEVVVETLIAAGVQRIYGVVGDSLNGILEEMRKHPKLHWIPVRHEETGAFASGAQAHLTGQLAVCAGSCGPGNTHLINGLYDCNRSRVPVLAIAAHIPSYEIGSNYFQETDPKKVFNECSHYCELVSQPSQMPRVLEIAIQTALTKRGVSVIIIPGDIALQSTKYRKPSDIIHYHKPVIKPTDREVMRLGDQLNKADNVTIFAGAGCEGAHDQLIEIAKKLQAPIVTTVRGREFVQYNNPYDVGLTGLIGYSSGYHAIKNCSTLLMLGIDFPYTQFYPENSYIIQIDERGENLGRRTRIDLGLIGNVKETLTEVLPLVKQKTDDGHLKTYLKDYKNVIEHLNDLAEKGKDPKVIHPQYLTKLIDKAASDDAIFTCDVGTPVIWAARYLTMNGKRRLLGSFSHGSMANALPQAIGAQLQYPERQVVTLSGDGGIAMLLGDLLTVKQLNLPIKIFVFKNNVLGFVELEMKAAGILANGTELTNPDFAALAESAGIHGINVNDSNELEGAVKKAFEHKGPVLVSVNVNKLELSMPPTIEIDQAVGFNLWALKAVLNGKGDQVLDLARTNIFR
jgi:pyruvate dehydrogenase (quinone)